MSYANRTQLEAAFTSIEISNLEAGGRDIDDALDKASQEVDTYLAGRYQTPITFAPLPGQLVSVVCDIARYRLYASSSDDEIRNRYEDAVRWLTKVSSGSVILPGVLLAAQEGSSAPGQSPPRHGKIRSKFHWGGYGG